MKRNLFFKGLVVMLAMSRGLAATESSQRANVLIILSDDQG
jgi:hypothetical protein